MTTKRRAAATASLGTASPGQKRRKVSGDNSTPNETPRATTEAGLKFLEHIKQSTDKNGRPISTSFLHLPDRKDNAEYYKAIVLPIALDTVEEKLNKYEYSNISALEGDLKRMVSNAKFYNEKSSVIFADAERIRKILSNNMPKLNPAYKDPKYVALPTPLPDEADDEDEEGDAELEQPSEPIQGGKGTDSLNGRTSTNTPATGDGEVNENFEGDTFQSAQERIINEMIKLEDSDGEEVGGPFISKPDRNLYNEYYEIIDHPVSLRGLQRQVRGTDTRKKSNRTTAFKSWDAFEEEVSYLWQNARLFNEDGSEIYMLAGTLENFFKRRLAEAKQAVPEPPQEQTDPSAPRIKLKVGAAKTPEPSSQRLTLKFAGQKAESPSTAETNHTGVTDENDVSKRQSNGRNAREQPVRGTPTTTRTLRNSASQGSPRLNLGIRHQPSRGSVSQERQASIPAASPRRGRSVTAVKNETPAAASSIPSSREESEGSTNPAGALPAASDTAPSSLAEKPTMPPPASNTPGPSGDTPLAPPVQPPPRAPAPTSPLDNRLRKPGQNATNALIQNVALWARPQTAGANPGFHIDLPASPTQTQYSFTVNLPPSQQIFTIVPTTAHSSVQRQVMNVVMGGNRRLEAVRSGEKNTYELSLVPGLTVVRVEAVMGPPRGVPRTGVQDLEYEQVTIYVNLMRA